MVNINPIKDYQNWTWTKINTSSVKEYCHYCGEEILREQTTMWLDGKTYHLECYFHEQKAENHYVVDLPKCFTEEEIRKIVKEEVINVFRSLSS
jgi:hypothetical protein